MCQLLWSTHNLLYPPARPSRRQWCTRRFRRALRSVRDAEFDETVAPRSGDVPEGSLETTLASQDVVNRRLKCVDERADSAMLTARPVQLNQRIFSAGASGRRLVVGLEEGRIAVHILMISFAHDERGVGNGNIFGNVSRACPLHTMVRPQDLIAVG
jgi:hypothetical protein